MDCVAGANDCGEEEGEVTAGVAGVDDGEPICNVARMPPIATMTAAIPVRIPGIDVQNDFLWSSTTIILNILIN